MDWLLCIAITAFTGAANIFVDNYISDYYFKGRDANAQKCFHWIPHTIVGLVCICATGLDFTNIPIYIYLLFLLPGVISVVAGIFYYKALEVSESTDFGIFAQLAPIFYLILGWLFLGQNITSHQFIAFLIIIAAPILIILTTKKRSRPVRLKAVFYTILNIFIAAAGAILFVKLDAGETADVNFITEMGFVFLGQGIGNGLIVLANPKWRKRFRYVTKSSKHKVYYPLTVSLVFNIINKFARNLALVLAPSVALTTAITDSAKPIVIFFMGLLFTILWPRFGREKLTKKAVMVHLIATVLVVIGIFLIQSS